MRISDWSSDVCSSDLMDRKLSPEIERNVMAKYGMDKPLGEQYVNYLKDAVRGDFGPSLKYRDKSVLQILKENYKVSLTLGLSAKIGRASGRERVCQYV